MTRIKFCGLTRLDDVQLAAGLGVDAIGFVMTRRSKRFVDPTAAARLRDAVPPYITTVALVMDDEPAFIDEVLRVLRPDMLQFHGDETDEDCAAYGVRYTKAIAMGEGASALERLHRFPRAAGLLLDGHGLGEQGGSGQCFDWSLMPKDLAQPLILAGGLDADNVAEAIRVARPWAVDVSSGIESSPGIKDRAKMERFISAVRR
ncbi:N-(5'-phosphoribosyl)anthranilate isomerase [Luteibacter rhizovicinus DSM 16549]|uniref:N-(5'-phosphoribosyl)anthranilate isomerase n=1 Tax=Luteibacter rhizovicinus DSM 16549 TaxID=1440763 RepID=A0A1L3EVU4_9GAMM|nr:phosphoribosylanthranilate isomerase [Luteibacter rhizovicinus]APG05154.1 N-(5'-phosphoribosyl)anthranilate isomerase [Luteibacter rhizovicinus DSM 16549]KLD72844.1 N-(5'-phosphoribosyl)anthranilate isomerase [Xanthomonas hyacinthi DSM 19077]